jgi:hypothetical protein
VGQPRSDKAHSATSRTDLHERNVSEIEGEKAKAYRSMSAQIGQPSAYISLILKLLIYVIVQCNELSDVFPSLLSSVNLGVLPHFTAGPSQNDTRERRRKVRVAT